MQKPGAKWQHEASGARDKLVEITWDTMSAFLPLMGGGSAAPGSETDALFKLIAKFVAEAGGKVLDVGCGDGEMKIIKWSHEKKIESPTHKFENYFILIDLATSRSDCAKS